MAVSESNICSALETIELSRLRDMKLLIRPYCEHHAELADILEHAGIAHQKALHISQDTDLIPLVRADMGVCIIPRSIATGYGFRMIATEDFALRRSVSLHSVAGRQRTAAAGSLAGLLWSHNWQSDTSQSPSGTGPVAGWPQRVSPDHRLTPDPMMISPYGSVGKRIKTARGHYATARCCAPVRCPVPGIGPVRL